MSLNVRRDIEARNIHCRDMRIKVASKVQRLDEIKLRKYKQRREKISGPSPGGTYISDEWMKSWRPVKRLKRTRHRDKKKPKRVWCHRSRVKKEFQGAERYQL